jgi:hypothetical protein
MIAEKLLQDPSFTDLVEVIRASTISYQMIGRTRDHMATSGMDGESVILRIENKRTKQVIVEHEFPVDPVKTETQVIDEFKGVCDKILMTIIDTGLGFLDEKNLVVGPDGAQAVSEPKSKLISLSEQYGL